MGTVNLSPLLPTNIEMKSFWCSMYFFKMENKYINILQFPGQDWKEHAGLQRTSQQAFGDQWRTHPWPTVQWGVNVLKVCTSLRYTRHFDTSPQTCTHVESTNVLILTGPRRDIYAKLYKGRMTFHTSWAGYIKMSWNVSSLYHGVKKMLKIHTSENLWSNMAANASY